MKVHIKILNVEGIRISDIEGCEGIYTEVYLSNSKTSKRTKNCKKDPLFFSNDILSLSLKKQYYAKETIFFELNTLTKKKSTPICMLLLPLRICEKDRRISGMFKLTPENGFNFESRIKIQVHIGKKAFTNYEDMDISTTLLSEFVTEMNQSPIKLALPLLLSDSNCNRKSVQCEGNDEEIAEKIEKVMATAPAELLMCFKHPEFVHQCLKFYGIDEDTHA